MGADGQHLDGRGNGPPGQQDDPIFHRARPGRYGRVITSGLVPISQGR